MKFPFVSRKKYDLMQKNYKIASEGQRSLRKVYIEYQMKSKEELRDLQDKIGKEQDTNKLLTNKVDLMHENSKMLEKEIKYLKQLLTKNNVKYKNIDEREKRKKKGDKNGK